MRLRLGQGTAPPGVESFQARIEPPDRFLTARLGTYEKEGFEPPWRTGFEIWEKSRKCQSGYSAASSSLGIWSGSERLSDLGDRPMPVY
jgi:hypothetical protein